MLKFVVFSLLVAAVFAAPAPGVLHGGVGPLVTASSSSVVHSAALVAPAVHAVSTLGDVGVVGAAPAIHGLSLAPALHGATLAAPALHGATLSAAIPALSGQVLATPALTTTALHGSIIAAPAVHEAAIVSPALTSSHGLYGTAPLGLSLGAVHGIH